VARWQREGHLGEAVCIPFFSQDGKRLAAIILKDESDKSGAVFVDVDPQNKRAPRTLFESGPVHVAQFTPDNKGIVYVGVMEKNHGWGELMLWQEGQKEPRVLARLPGLHQFLPAFLSTAFFWVNDKRLRIYSIPLEGIRIIETDLDGTNAEAKLLSNKKLRIQKRLADVEWMLSLAAELPGEAVPLKEAGARMPEGPANPAEKKPVDEALVKENAEVDAATKPLYDLLKTREADARKLLDALWEQADKWEKVPAVPEVPDEEKAKE
jgi:hypothetical protein